ncbi:hypothetical protein NNJEOMEG_03015 [Fundidesulfovibrio magnetotacticus]|uniref:PilZ domain-containing protein n=1 Tax=Fundidesulfovibrio magnetotacticus TaxID=2730080 RepID=A0A6V8LZV6_9BACT|nr:hypothetical protein [Fundidesulfovibrio magnetotacticus]GFK95157.1 hypothetical protein NNJEOMEG_03015 [Fundidesulfovibrio magnetotacticus]
MNEGLGVLDIPRFDAALEDFFSRMFEDILAGRVTLESVLLVVAFFGAFAGLTTLAFVFSKQPKEVMLEKPITWITGYGQIMDLLDAAVAQRSKVRVSFHRDLGAARSSDGTLLEAGKDGLVLEMSSIRAINPAWVGRTLELSFRLRMPDNPKLLSTFSFIAEITGYEQLPDEVLLLKLSRPLRLELNQNRMHLRVEPPDKYVRTFRLWAEDHMPRRADLHDPDHWGEPTYSWTYGEENEVKLVNISGGGVRVEIAPAALRTVDNKITVNQHYYAQLTVAAPDFSGFATHYVTLRVLKCFDDCDSRSKLSLGMAFATVGVPNDPPLTGLRWRSVNRDFGVREIDDWAYELHLELYRNKGIA